MSVQDGRWWHSLWSPLQLCSVIEPRSGDVKDSVGLSDCADCDATHLRHGAVGTASAVDSNMKAQLLARSQPAVALSLMRQRPRLVVHLSVGL